MIFTAYRIDLFISFKLQIAWLGVQTKSQNKLFHSSFGVDGLISMPLFVSWLTTTDVSRRGKLRLRGPKGSTLLTYLSDADIERMGFRIDEAVVSRP